MHFGRVGREAQTGFKITPGFGQSPDVLLIGAGKAQELRNLLQFAQGASRCVLRRIQCPQQGADFLPAVAADVSGQRLNQVARFVELLPGSCRNLCRFERRGHVQQTDQRVVVADFGFVGVDQAAESDDGLAVFLLQFSQLASQPPVVDIIFVTQAGASLGAF